MKVPGAHGGERSRDRASVPGGGTDVSDGTPPTCAKPVSVATRRCGVGSIRDGSRRQAASRRP